MSFSLFIKYVNQLPKWSIPTDKGYEDVSKIDFATYHINKYNGGFYSGSLTYKDVPCVSNSRLIKSLPDNWELVLNKSLKA